MAALPTPETLDRLKALVGEGGWSDDPDRLAPKLVEWRDRWTGETPLLLLPRTTAEVAAIVALCAETGTALTPRAATPAWSAARSPRARCCCRWSACAPCATSTCMTT